MGKIVRVSTIVFLLLCSSNTYAEVYTTGSAVDNNGNIIVTGYCLGNVRIAGQEYTITQPSVYILKLDSDGEMIWVKFINCSQSIVANSIAVDSLGSGYIVGDFSGTANFESQLLTSQAMDFFVTKYDINGNLVWVKKANGSGDQWAKDVVLGDSEHLFIGGGGYAFTFDSLNVGNGGFLLKIKIDGTGPVLFHIFGYVETVDNIAIDIDGNLCVAMSVFYAHPYWNYWTSLAKLNNNGIIIWEKYPVGYNGGINYLESDSNLNLIVAGTARYDQETVGTRFSKFTPEGTGQFYKYYTLSTVFDITRTLDDNYLIQGRYKQNSQMGDSVLNSNGEEDAFIAKIDTSFNPIWIRYGGGSYKDELKIFSILTNGSIISIGNFRGQVTFDSVQISGSTTPGGRWVALAKFDGEGNLLSFKKICEDYIIPAPKNWFPTHKGNTWQYYDNFRYVPITYEARLVTISITDSIVFNNKTYYKVSNFFNFPAGTHIRYDLDTQRLYVLLSGVEQIYIDFLKSSGEIYSQIQPNGTFNDVRVINGNAVVLGDSIPTKGFYRSLGFILGDYNFSENLGQVNQDEGASILYQYVHNYKLIECILYQPDSLHIKHPYVPSINYVPITFIGSGNRMIQNFEIMHHYSYRTNGISIRGFSYVNNPYVESFYTNSMDTIWNSVYNIPGSTEIDFSLNYQFDTTKYEQGYHLYYRIAAVDKGIIADTFYSPQTGYYKLYWRDSTTSVTQISPEVFDYSLSQNYPNPFNPSSKISFSIPERGFVSLKVFDILGAQISTLVSEELDAGKYEVVFDGSKLSSGVYIYQVVSGNYMNTKKMMLVK